MRVKNILLGAMLPLVLAACDRTAMEFDVLPCCEFGEKTGMIKMALYSDGHAVATIHGQKVPLSVDKDKEWLDERNLRYIEFVGTLPGDGGEIVFSGRYDAERHLLAINSVGEKQSGYSATVFRPFRMPEKMIRSSEEVCVSAIKNKLDVVESGLAVGHGVSVHLGDKDSKGVGRSWVRELIPANDAMRINEKWDYSSKDWWKTDGGHKRITDFGGRPCDVLDRLNKYISDNKLDGERKTVICEKPQYVYMTCMNLPGAGFQYLSLGQCDDGRGVLLEWDRGYVDVFVMMRDADADIWRAQGDYAAFSVKRVDDGDYMLETPDGAVKCSRTDMLYEHQKCARRIAGITRVTSDGVVEFDIEHRLVEGKLKQKFVPLTQEQALSVTHNWDYSNLRMYETGDLPHEIDACDALKELDMLRYKLKDNN